MCVSMGLHQNDKFSTNKFENLKIDTFTYCFTTLECNRFHIHHSFPSKFFSHMNFMKTSFSCCIEFLIWT